MINLILNTFHNDDFIFDSKPNKLSNKEYFLYFLKLINLKNKKIDPNIDLDFINNIIYLQNYYSEKSLMKNEFLNDGYFQNQKQITAYVDKSLKHDSYEFYNTFSSIDKDYSSKLTKCIAFFLNEDDNKILKLYLKGKYGKNLESLNKFRIFYLGGRRHLDFIIEQKQINYSFIKYVINFKTFWKTHNQPKFEVIFDIFKSLENSDKYKILQLARRNHSWKYNKLYQDYHKKNHLNNLFAIFSSVLTLTFVFIFKYH